MKRSLLALIFAMQSAWIVAEEPAAAGEPAATETSAPAATPAAESAPAESTPSSEPVPAPSEPAPQAEATPATETVPPPPPGIQSAPATAAQPAQPVETSTPVAPTSEAISEPAKVDPIPDPIDDVETTIAELEPGSGNAKIQAEEAYNQGLEAFNAGKRQAAIDFWRRAVALDPQHAKAQANLTKAMEEGTAAPKSEKIMIERVSVDDAGTKLLILVQTSKPIEAFVFERRDPPSLFVQFTGTAVYAAGNPIQVVGLDPLSEIRYGFSNFQDAATARTNANIAYKLDYLELRMNRPAFYHVQQEGWVMVIGLDRTTAKVAIPELDFRFESAKHEGAAQLPPNARLEDFVSVAQSNSQLLAVARDEAELAKARVWEAGRALAPQVTGRYSATRGKEVNPFPSEDFEGFEATSFKRDEYGVQVTQPIWQSGRLYGAYRQSKLNRLMANENVRKQAQDLTYEMKKAYYGLLKNQTILRIRRELVAQGEVIKDLVKKKHKLDLTSKAEVLNVVAQADQASYQLTSDEQDVALARLVVISLLNQSQPLADPVPGALSFGRLSFNVESIISWAQEHRPDVRIAMLNTELARYNMKAARADNGIKLDASGFYGRAGAAFAEDDFELSEAWNIGLRASRAFYGNTLRGFFSKEHTAPDLGQSFITESQQKSVELGLWDNMPGRSNERQSELQYERAKAELVDASRKAEFEVRQTYYNLEKAARQLDAVREDLKYRQKDLEITREKVKLGLSELSQLMAAEIAYAQAQIAEQDALSAYNIALAEMDRVAGAEVVRQ